MGLGDPLAQSLGNLRIDPAFVLDLEHRPKRKHDDYSASGDSIPIIDLAALRANTLSKDERSTVHDLVAQVGKACQEWGFFQVVNHGIPLRLVEDLEANSQEFFNLALEEKRKVRRTYENALGYYDTELTKNVRDWKEVFDFAPRGVLELPVEWDTGGKPTTQTYENQWPSTPSTLREVCERWSKAVEGLAFEVLGLISQSLGLPATHFHHHWKENMNLIRLNYYPKCPNPDLALGVSRHKDSGALTVLVQDEVGGLEVRRKDGEWIGVQPRRDAFVINVGDILQVWSNDKYQSVEHRVVVNENKPRVSFPLFFNPSYDTDVAPVPEILGTERPLYRQYNWGHFIKTRQNGNFKNLGAENLQIYHYAINRDQI